MQKVMFESMYSAIELNTSKSPTNLCETFCLLILTYLFMIDDIAEQTMDLLFNNEKFKKNVRKAVGCFVIVQLVILLLLIFIIFRLNNNLNIPMP